MNTAAGLIVFKALPGAGAEVAHQIAAALPAVQAEDGTPLWLLLQSGADADTLFLVDLFKGVEGREAHMQGSAAKWIFEKVPGLLASAPEIHPAELLAAKGV